MFGRAATIGVDTSGRAMGIVQLARGPGRQVRLRAATVARSSNGPEVSSEDCMRAAEAIHAQSMEGVNVATAIGVKHQLVAVVEIPAPDSGAPIDEIARAELAREVKKEEGAIESVWWALPATGRASDVSRALCVGIERESAVQAVEMLEGCGLTPLALAFRGSVLVHACRKLLGGDGKLTAIVEVGEGETITCVCLGSMIVFYRKCDVGVATIREGIARVLHADEEIAAHVLQRVVAGEAIGGVQGADVTAIVQASVGEIAESVRAAFAYVAHRYSRAELGEVLVTGEGADTLNVRSALEAATELAARVVTLGDVTGVSDHPLSDRAGLVVAAGLSMYGEAA